MVLVAASSDNKDLVDNRSKNLQVYGKSDGDSDILLVPKLIDEVKDGVIAITMDNVDKEFLLKILIFERPKPSPFDISISNH